MSYMLSSRPVKGGGHKYTCGKLSVGRWCWNNVFSGCRQSGVSLWSAFCGHYSTATRRPNHRYCTLGVKWMHMMSTAFVDVAGLDVVVGMSGWNFG